MEAVKGKFLWDVRNMTCVELKETQTFGREGNTYNYSTDFTISSTHCLITGEEDNWLIKDLGSKNGIFLNTGKEPVNNLKLKSFDLIKFGDQLYIFLDELLYDFEDRTIFIRMIEKNCNEPEENEIAKKSILLYKKLLPNRYTLRKIGEFEKKIGIANEHRQRVEHDLYEINSEINVLKVECEKFSEENPLFEIETLLEQNTRTDKLSLDRIKKD